MYFYDKTITRAQNVDFEYLGAWFVHILVTKLCLVFIIQQINIVTLNQFIVIYIYIYIYMYIQKYNQSCLISDS